MDFENLVLDKRLIDVTVRDLKREIAKEIILEFRSDIDFIKNQLKNENDRNEKWLSRNEAKEILNVSLVTLNKWAKIGVLKSYKIGGTVRYKYSDIKEKLK